MSQVMYRQCELRLGTAIDVAWIPSQFAVKGKFLKVKGVNGWQVTSIGAILPEDIVLFNERDHTRTRIGSDI